jgi:ribose 5-phosphate isomerase A
MADAQAVAVARRAAAEAAVAMVEDGMTLGLGTGSTAGMFVEALGRRVGEGLSVVGVATSLATAAQAGALGVPLATLDDVGALDLTVDGADEVDGRLRLIKGGGGALLCEKIVAAASDRMVVVADWRKRVDALGRFPLPVEIVRFGAGATERSIRRTLGEHGLSGEIRRRRDARGVFVTDEGHEIADLHLGAIPDPAALEAALARLPGVVESGLFTDLADTVLIGREDGSVETLRA